MPRGFVEGFTPGLQNAANIISRKFINDAERERYELKQEEAKKQKLAEDQKKADEERQALEVTGKLLKGGTTQKSLSIDPATGGKDYFTKYDTTEKQNLLNQLSSSDINRYQDIQKETTSAERKLKLKYDQPFLYQEDAATGERIVSKESNPYYMPKKKNTATGYNAQGEKVIKNFYEDGRIEEIPTGFHKKNSGEGGDSFDLAKYNKTINSFTEQDIKLSKLKSEYSMSGDELTKYQINELNEDNEQTLYNLLDDDSQNVVKSFYTELKDVAKKHGKDFTMLEREKQEELKKKFQEKIVQTFTGSSEDYARKRALILWSKFKYGYVE